MQVQFHSFIWMFPKIGVPQNGFIMENPIKMDDLGGFPIIFGSTPISNGLLSPRRVKFPVPASPPVA